MSCYYIIGIRMDNRIDNDAIALAGEVRDHATRDILIQILNDEDRHMDELEELLDQIEQMTLPMFLITQVD
jgi:bacterioferritin